MSYLMKLAAPLVAAAGLAGCVDTGGDMMDTPAMAQGGLPTLNATCPGGISVHADQGGPVYINGSEASLKKFNDNFYEARGGGVTVSISRNADGTMGVSYNKPGANGICTVS